MNTDAKLMAWLKFGAAGLLLAMLAAMVLGPMFGLKPPDASMVERVGTLVLIVINFLFGSSAGSAKKDDTIAGLSQPDKPTDPPKQ